MVASPEFKLNKTQSLGLHYLCARDAALVCCCHACRFYKPNLAKVFNLSSPQSMFFP